MASPPKPPQRHDTIVEHYAHDDADHAKIHVQRIVVISIDPGSAEYVVNWALDNYIRPDSDLVVLVHVRVLEIPMAPYVDSTGYMDDVAEERRDESHTLLKSWATKLWHKQIACKAISMIGDPKQEIVRKVTESHADILIMGSRNLGTFKRTFLGSVSDHCVHHAPCTVVIAKPSVPDSPERESSRKTFLSRIASS